MRGYPLASVFSKICFAISLAFFLNACALNRNIDVDQAYTVSDVSSMTKTKKVQWARVTPGFSIADYDSIYIPEVTLEGSAKMAPLGATLAEDLRERVLRELEKKYPVTTDQAASAGAGKHATLQMALGDVQDGNGFARWLLGLGVGPTVLQVEGKITETGTDEPVVEFVRHRSFDGYPAMGLNVTIFSAKKTHQFSMKGIARDIAAFLGKAGAK